MESPVNPGRFKAQLVRDVLGISKGDDVSFFRDGKTVKFRVSHTSVHIDENEVSFHLYGPRYNKDGLLGKRDEWINLRVARNSRQR